MVIKGRNLNLSGHPWFGFTSPGWVCQPNEGGRLHSVSFGRNFPGGPVFI
jgi:hypothetical protein